MRFRDYEKLKNLVDGGWVSSGNMTEPDPHAGVLVDVVFDEKTPDGKVGLSIEARTGIGLASKWVGGEMSDFDLFKRVSIFLYQHIDQPIREIWEMDMPYEQE